MNGWQMSVTQRVHFIWPARAAARWRNSPQIRGVRQGLGYFLAINLAKPLAQPVNRHPGGAFIQAQLFRDTA
jgi:hypothetical protein